MNLLEAIKLRKTIRAYKPDPVSKEMLTEILDIARWAPSGANSQPWEFLILTGDVLKELNHTHLEKIHSKNKKHCPDIEMFLKAPKGTYAKRALKFFKQFLNLIVTEDGKKKMQKWFELSSTVYGAPALIIIVADKKVSGWFLLDIGLVTQTIALVAQEYGLGTSILGDVIFYPEELRRIVNIPNSKQIIIGIAIGYPDWNNPLNSLRTDREPIEKLMTWCEIREEEEKNV